MRRERSTVVSRLVLLVALASLLVAVGKPGPGTSEAAGQAPRACTPEGYGLTARYVPSASRAQNAVRLTVGWLTAKEERRDCLLQATIHVTIADSDGVVVSADWDVNGVRRPWSGIVHTWVWQNWCDADGQVTVQFSDADETTSGQLISSPPACVSPDAPSSLTDLGTGTKYVERTSQRIPPQIVPEGSPPPIPYAVINPKNAWLVSDGYTLVAAYAGSPGENPSRGRFAILRQNAIFGVEYFPPDRVNLGKVGAVTITRAPHGRSRETTAQTGRLAFVSTNGTRGVLDLRTDRARITHRG